jgi:hypothetical protein
MPALITPPNDQTRATRPPLMDLLPVLLPCVAGAGMIAIAIFGLWVAAAVARPSGDPLTASAEGLLAPAKFILSWMVMFGPFFFLGSAMLRSAIRKNWPEARAWRLFAAPGTPRWLTPGGGSGYAAQLERYEMEGPAPTVSPAAPLLDDESAYKADRAGYLLAKWIGAAVGILLTIGGSIGLVLTAIDVHRPAYWEMASWRLATLPLLVASVLALLAGILVLRDMLVAEQTAWLAPLRTFGIIVWLRAFAETQRDGTAKTGQRVLRGPGSGKLLR